MRAATTTRRRDIQLAYLLLAPTLLLLLTVLAYPVGWEVWTSLTDLSPLKDGPPAFVGLANYRAFLADPEFWRGAGGPGVGAAVARAAERARGAGFAPLLARAVPRRRPGFPAGFPPRGGPAGRVGVGWLRCPGPSSSRSSPWRSSSRSRWPSPTSPTCGCSRGDGSSSP